MDTVPYTMRCSGFTLAVDAVHPVPGLYVYLTPKDHQSPDHPYHWLIGHESGQAIAGFERSADALDVVHELADFTNWDRTAEELLADQLLDPYELRDFIEAMGGVFFTRQPATA